MSIEQIYNNIDADIEELERKSLSIQVVNKIPEYTYLETFKWFAIPNLTCVFVDMVDSTKLPLNEDSARVYQVFVSSFVKIFKEFNAEYIDIKGDGGFALFTGKESVIPALCSAITFKSVCYNKIRNKFKYKEISSHIGIDTGQSIVKRIGLKGENNNEVWLGIPVNTASKLLSLAGRNEIAITKRVFDIINQEEYKKYLVYSCGCDSNNGTINNVPVNLWEEIDTPSYVKINTLKIYKLLANWCSVHGDQFCESIMNIYKKRNNV